MGFEKSMVGNLPGESSIEYNTGAGLNHKKKTLLLLEKSSRWLKSILLITLY